MVYWEWRKSKKDSKGKKYHEKNHVSFSFEGELFNIFNLFFDFFIFSYSHQNLYDKNLKKKQNVYMI